MDYKQHIIDELTNKTKLKPNSIKLYSIRLNNLYKDLGGDFNNKHLSNKITILKYINKLKNLDSKVATYNAIIKIIPDGELKDFYSNERIVINQAKFEKYKNNMKNEKFIEYNKLLEGSPPPTYEDNSIKNILLEFISYISVRHPIRLSLSDMEIIHQKKDADDVNKNYILVTQLDIRFIMNNFKNVASMGQQVISITDKTEEDEIRKYYKYMKRRLKEQNDTMKYFLYNHYAGKIIPI